MKRKACECLRVPPEGHFQKSLIMRLKNLMIRDFLWQDHTTFAGSYGICRIIRHLQAGQGVFSKSSSGRLLPLTRCFGAALALFWYCSCAVFVLFWYSSGLTGNPQKAASDIC